MAETWLRSIRKALWGTATVSCVAMRVKMRSVRPTVASAAGTKDLHNYVQTVFECEFQGGAHVANKATGISMYRNKPSNTAQDHAEPAHSGDSQQSRRVFPSDRGLREWLTLCVPRRR